MTRRNLLLTLILVAQIALIALLFWPQAQAEATGPLFPGLAVEDVTGLTLHYDGDTVTLAKTGDGWVLPDKGGYPVNEVTVSDLLTKVVQLDTSRLVAGSASSLNRLQVAETDYVRKVEMTRANGDPLTLYLGSSPNARATHVRNGDNNNVYLASALSTADVRMDTAAWVDTLYLQTVSDEIKALTLENANGAFALTRDESGGWTTGDLAPDENVNVASIDLLLNRLVSLTFIDVTGTEPLPEQGLDSPSATLTLTVAPTSTVTAAGGAPVVLEIGTKAEENNRYPVRVSLSDYVVEVSGATLDPFVQYGRGDLVVTPAITETVGITPTTVLTETTP